MTSAPNASLHAKVSRLYRTSSPSPGPRLFVRCGRLIAMPRPRLNAACYADSVNAFLRASDDEVYAPLASPHGYTLAAA